MIIHGDATKIPLADNSVDTCITDPPYELGFMGKHWDSSGVAFNPATWTEVYRVLKPGGLLLAFGGTRTYHRMVCAIEDAGFEIRDTIGWVYGSGFPKSLDISKAIDKQAGAEGEVIGKEKIDIGMQSGSMHAGRESKIVEREVRAPATPEAQLFNGWGTALKPAMELIVVAMKPLDGTYAENALKWGVAGYWIDGGRVDGKRWPSNFIHDGSDEVLELFPDTGKSTGGRIGNKGSMLNMMGTEYEAGDPGYGDEGSAARFFYCAKASRAERNAGLEGAEPKWIDETRKPDSIGGNNPRNRGARADTNFHPTVKPLELMRYLVRLTKTPTGGIVLDPFMGSGTTGCACALEGREFIGIEKEAEYVEIAEKRIAYWSKQPRLV